MRATLRVENNGKVVELDLFNDLFAVEIEPQEPEEPPAEIEWRPVRQGKNFKEAIYTLTPTNVTQRGRYFTIHYNMANDKTCEEHTFNIPNDNLPFIGDAVEQGVIEIGKPLKVTMEKEGKLWRWCKIERI